MENKLIITSKEIENQIYTVRGQQVMLDSDLASIYQVETKVFNQAVKRNANRFPESFRFQLAQEEFDAINLRSQIVTSSLNYGGRRYLPYVFTEQGIAMLASILRSTVAIKVSIEIMNAFVEMRRMLMSNASLFHRLDKIELKQLEANQKFEEILRLWKVINSTAKKVFFIMDKFSMPIPLFPILSEVPKALLSCWIIT